MPEESGRTRFHYGFYAAMKVEYDLMHAEVTYEQEIQLGEDPVRLDFLIIKKAPHVVLNDPIGEFFEAVNIFEYKSPEDGLSIDDFYKAVGYSLIYKGYDRKVNELPIRDMTLTIVRHSYPRGLMKALREDGYTVEERHPGIYRISGKINVKVQLIVSSRLHAHEYDGLKLIAKGCKKDDIVHYAEKAAASGDGNVKTNAETVIEICLNINKKVSQQLKEDADMDIGATIRGIFEVAEKVGRQEGIQQGRQEGINEDRNRLATDMLKDGVPLEKIVRYSRLAEDTIRNIAKSLGVAVM